MSGIRRPIAWAMAVLALAGCAADPARRPMVTTITAARITALKPATHVSVTIGQVPADVAGKVNGEALERTGIHSEQWAKACRERIGEVLAYNDLRYSVTVNGNTFGQVPAPSDTAYVVSIQPTGLSVSSNDRGVTLSMVKFVASVSPASESQRALLMLEDRFTCGVDESRFVDALVAMTINALADANLVTLPSGSAQIPKMRWDMSRNVLRRR